MPSLQALRIRTGHAIQAGVLGTPVDSGCGRFPVAPPISEQLAKRSRQTSRPGSQ